MSNRSVIVRSALAAALAAIAGCSAGDPSAPASPQETLPAVVLEGPIGASGGLLEAPAGSQHDGLRLYVPPGALSGPAEVRVSRVAKPREAAAGYRFVTAFYEADFSGASLEKPFRLRMPVMPGETVSEGVAAVRAEAVLGGYDPALLARVDTGPDGIVIAADEAGVFAGVSRTGGPEASVASVFDPSIDAPAVDASAAKTCRFGAVFSARHQFLRTGGLNSRFDRCTALMAAQQAEARYRIERLGMPSAVGAEQETTAQESMTALRIAIGATGRPAVLLLTGSIPLLAYAATAASVSCYNPSVGPSATQMEFSGSSFSYYSVVYPSVPAPGHDPRMDAPVESVMSDFSQADTLIESALIGASGGTLNVSTTALAGSSIEIGAGDLGADTQMRIALPGWNPPPPTGAELCSAYMKLTGPADNLFLGQIAVTLKYADPGSASEGRLQLGCYSPKNDSWALTQISARDTTANTIRGLCRTAGVFAVFGFAALPSGRTTSASSTFIYHAWPTGESEQDVVNALVARGIRRLHISALERVGHSSYYCRFPLEAGMTGAAGISHAYTWFDYSTLMSLAHAAGIQVVFAATIFNDSGLNPDDPDTPGTHAHHFVNTVAPFLRDQCPDLDGIMLDYIRFPVGTWTESDRDLVSRIVARIREQLGRKGPARAHRLYACVWCFTGGNEDGRMAVGQRYSDFAMDCDVLVPMMYGGNDPYPAADLEWYSLRTALYRTQRNLTGTLAGLMTYGNSTPSTIQGHLEAALSWHMDGFAMYRYDLTSSAEWDVIDDRCE